MYDVFPNEEHLKHRHQSTNDFFDRYSEHLIISNRLDLLYILSYKSIFWVGKREFSEATRLIRVSYFLPAEGKMFSAILDTQHYRIQPTKSQSWNKMVKASYQTWGQFRFVNSNSTHFHLVNSTSNFSIPNFSIPIPFSF